MTWVGKQPEKSNRCMFLSVLLFIMKWEHKITDQQQKNSSLNPDGLCYSSVLSPRAGMRKHSTQVKSSAEVKQFCMLALGQNKVPQTSTEWALACEAVLLDISWKRNMKYVKSISTKLKKYKDTMLLKFSTSEMRDKTTTWGASSSIPVWITCDIPTRTATALFKHKPCMGVTWQSLQK